MSTPSHPLTHPLGPLVMSTQTMPVAGFVARVEAAAAAGYTGIGLRPADRQRALSEEGLTDADLRAVLATNGVAVIELEVLRSFALEGQALATSREQEAALYDMAGAIGGRHLIAVSDLAGDLDAAAEAFAGVCDRAAEHGLLVGLEFLPWTDIADAGVAWDIVRRADRPGGGVLVDSWHHYRGAADDALLQALPGDRITAIQLDDADAEQVGTMYEDTLQRRRLPGEGDFDLVRFLRVLAGTGTTAPICVEVISDAQRAMAPAEAAGGSADATRRVLDEAFPA